MKKRWIVLAIVLGLVFVVVGIAVGLFWQLQLKPWIQFEKYRGNMREIGAAINDFSTDRGQLPTSLRDIVQGGYLPERSPVYRCPLLHDSLRDVMVSYADCEFDMRFDPNEVVVSAPRSAIDRFRLDTAPSYLVECRIDRSGFVTAP